MLRIGLTGGIASGKSTVAKLWENWGAVHIDCDDVSRSLTQIGKPNYQAIVSNWGDSILDSQRNIDRKKLAQIVFNDYSQLTILNEICSPAVLAECREKVQSNQDKAIVVVGMPLLFELNLRSDFDFVVAVVCSEQEQIRRLEKRNNIVGEMALRRIRAMFSNEQKAALADFVIWNERTTKELTHQARAIWDYLVARPIILR
jgi:dephospho-CoA kinase